MATECFTLTRGHTIRVTELDECGEIPVGAVQVTSKGFTTVTVNPDVEAGEELFVRNASGDICVNEKDPDALKRLMVDVEMCLVDPDLVGLITDYPVEVESGDNVGFRVVTGAMSNSFALEVWTKLAGEHACGADGACYGYVLLPFLTGGSLGQFEVGSESVNLNLTGAYTGDNSQWGVGPYDVVGTDALPAPLAVAIAAGQVAVVRTTCVSPPEASCGSALVPVPGP